MGPDAIRPDPAGQGIFLVRDPIREFQTPAFGLWDIRGPVAVEDLDEAARDDVTGVLELAALQKRDVSDLSLDGAHADEIVDRRAPSGIESIENRVGNVS